MKQNLNTPTILPVNNLPPGEGGGKASGLARLACLGLSVPKALVVLNALPGNIPPGISDEWREFGGDLAAVRSSGSDEDGEEASAAGQFETYLNIVPEDLEDAVCRCLESAGSERVHAYEQELSGSTGSAMSVVIQEMVKPSRAGVLFSADPMTGSRDIMVIEAVAGLGEDLVSGHAEAAGYRIDAITGEIREQSGDLQAAGLSAALIEDLRTGAVLASADWGTPLDLEWAVDSETGEIRWLQARPITALADSLDSDISSETLVTRCNIGEMMPGAVTPLTRSTFGRSLSTGLAMFYRSFGALRKSEPDPSFIESFEDQLFMNMSSMYLLSHRVLGASVEATELSILGYVLPPHDAGRPAPVILQFLNGMRYFAGLMSWKRDLKKLDRLANGFSIKTEGLDAAALHSAIKAAHKAVMDRAVALHYAASGFSGAMNSALAMTLSGGGTEISDEANRLMTELLSGVDGVESAAVLEGLEELAGILRDAGRESILDGDDSGRIHEALLSDSSTAGEFYRVFMERHGHRCIREAELREPEWALEPGHLIDSLRALTLAAPRPAPDKPVFRMPPLPDGVNPKAIAWITRQARIGVKTREKSKSLLILVTHHFKLAARALSAKMKNEGYLPEADLAYFLTMEELEDLLRGNGEGLIGRALRRRRRYPERQELRFPDISAGRPVPEEPPLPTDGMNFSGTPVSRGVVEGIVRVVKERNDAEALQSGEIMVAQFTDIGWTPFYGRVAGMITEIGGALSHGSVVAREYGLPLVGGLTGACTLLQTGMKIRLDGGRGIVTIMDKERKEETASV